MSGRDGAVKPAEFLPLKEVERLHILRVYRACDERTKVAAAHLGISLKTLYNKINQYTLEGRMDE